MKINEIHSSWYLWAGAHLSIPTYKHSKCTKVKKDRKVEAIKETYKDKEDKHKRRFRLSKYV